MDQTLSLSHQTSATSSRALQASVTSAPLEAVSPEEEPESPGRSPRHVRQSAAVPDPLAEGIAALAGVLLALMAVVVPLATVIGDSTIGDSTPPPSTEALRVGW